MPEIYFPSATDTPPRTDYTTTPWVDSANGGKWLWTESLSAWNPKQTEVFEQQALDVGIDPNTLIITGITAPADRDPLVLTMGGLSRDADGNVAQWWHAGSPGSNDLSVHVSSIFGVWSITIGGSFSYTYEAIKISSAKTPVGLTGWTIITGAGQPILEGNDKFPSYVGQLGTSYPGSGFGVVGPPWFRWNGHRWQEDVGAPLRLSYTPVSDQLFIEAGLTSNIPTSIPALTLRLGNPTFSKTWLGRASGVSYVVFLDSDGSWVFRAQNYPTSYHARSVSTTDESPIDVTAWTVTIGTGQPVITGTVANPPIDILGRTAIVDVGGVVSQWSAVSWGEWMEITNTTVSAAQVPYINTVSGLAAVNVQAAIDEVAATTPTTASIVILDLLTTTARKEANSYAATGGPVVGVTRVTTSINNPGILWTLVALPVGQDTSWIGQPYTVDPSGDIIVSMEIANVTGTVPNKNVLGESGGVISIGDGITAGGRKVLMNTKPVGYVTMTSVNATVVTLTVKQAGASGVCYSINGGTPIYLVGGVGVNIALTNIVAPKGAPTNIAIWPATSATSGRVGNLTSLYCENTGLTTLDVSGLTALTSLYCNNSPALSEVVALGFEGATTYGSSGYSVNLINCGLTTDAVWSFLNQCAYANDAPSFIKLAGNPCDKNDGATTTAMMTAGTSHSEADVETLLTAKGYSLILSDGTLTP